MSFERTACLALLSLALIGGPAVVQAEANAGPAGKGPTARDAALRAQALFEAGDYRGAAFEYERAHRLLDAGERRHAVLNNLALCYERLREYQKALEYYQRYLEEASPEPADRREVERIMEGLRDLLGELHVESNVVAHVWVDEQLRGRTPLTLPLNAGDHVVELRAEGYESERKLVSVRPRGRESLALRLRAEPSYRGASPGYFYGGVGASAAALVTGAALGGRALSLRNAAEARREAAGGDPNVNTVADEEKINRMSIAADVTLGVGALFTVSTLVLGFLTDFSGDRPPQSQPAPRRPVRISLHPEVGLRRAGVELTGSFR